MGTKKRLLITLYAFTSLFCLVVSLQPGSALKGAAIGGHLAVAEQLVEHGADLNAKRSVRISLLPMIARATKIVAGGNNMCAGAPLSGAECRIQRPHEGASVFDRARGQRKCESDCTSWPTGFETHLQFWETMNANRRTVIVCQMHFR